MFWKYMLCHGLGPFKIFLYEEIFDLKLGEARAKVVWVLQQFLSPTNYRCKIAVLSLQLVSELFRYRSARQLTQTSIERYKNKLVLRLSRFSIRNKTLNAVTNNWNKSIVEGCLLDFSFASTYLQQTVNYKNRILIWNVSNILITKKWYML